MTNDVTRPEGWMGNPYIGDDGRDYHSAEALDKANQAHRELVSGKIIRPDQFREIPKTLINDAFEIKKCITSKIDVPTPLKNNKVYGALTLDDDTIVAEVRGGRIGYMSDAQFYGLN